MRLLSLFIVFFWAVTSSAATWPVPANAICDRMEPPGYCDCGSGAKYNSATRLCEGQQAPNSSPSFPVPAGAICDRRLPPAHCDCGPGADYDSQAQLCRRGGATAESTETYPVPPDAICDRMAPPGYCDCGPGGKFDSAAQVCRRVRSAPSTCTCDSGFSEPTCSPRPASQHLVARCGGERPALQPSAVCTFSDTYAPYVTNVRGTQYCVALMRCAGKNNVPAICQPSLCNDADACANDPSISAGPSTITIEEIARRVAAGPGQRTGPTTNRGNGIDR